jgi:hypothetical protein
MLTQAFRFNMKACGDNSVQLWERALPARDRSSRKQRSLHASMQSALLPRSRLTTNITKHFFLRQGSVKFERKFTCDSSFILTCIKWPRQADNEGSPQICFYGAGCCRQYCCLTFWKATCLILELPLLIHRNHEFILCTEKIKFTCKEAIPAYLFVSPISSDATDSLAGHVHNGLTYGGHFPTQQAILSVTCLILFALGNKYLKKTTLGTKSLKNSASMGWTAVAQSIKRQATSWETQRSEFEFR